MQTAWINHTDVKKIQFPTYAKKLLKLTLTEKFFKQRGEVELLATYDTTQK